MPPRTPRLSATLRGASRICRYPTTRCRNFSISKRACEKEKEDDRARLDFNHTQALRTCQTLSNRPPWIHETKARIGKCILSGLDEQGGQLAAAVLVDLARQWRRLIVAEYGFLTGGTGGTGGESGESGERGRWKRQAVLWGEMDSMKHVNNVTYSRYAETGRIDWIMEFAKHHDPKHNKEWSQLLTPTGNGLILRSLFTKFKFPITWPDHISIYHKLHALPRYGDSSFVLSVVIVSEKHQRIAAQCVEDIVMYDYAAGKTTPLERFMLKVFTKTWELQEAEKEWFQEQHAVFEKAVRFLEYLSWDEEGWEKYRMENKELLEEPRVESKVRRIGVGGVGSSYELRETMKDLVGVVEKSDLGYSREKPDGMEKLPREKQNRDP